MKQEAVVAVAGSRSTAENEENLRRQFGGARVKRVRVDRPLFKGGEPAIEAAKGDNAADEPKRKTPNSGSQTADEADELRALAVALDRHGHRLHHGKKLGCGRYSKVRLVQRGDGSQAAVKVIDLARVTEEYRRKFIRRETNIWEGLRHVNIVRLYDTFMDGNRLFMVTEYADGGDLLTWVQERGAVNESAAALWFGQLVNAVDYLHSKRVAHRDLKLENILIADSARKVLVADFGFCRSLTWGETSMTFCGSKAYSSPEILQGRPYDPFRSDVWALGIVFYVAVCDRMPFDEHVGRNAAIVENQRLRRYSFPEHLLISRRLQQLIDLMLTFDWRLRPNIWQVSHSPYWAGIDKTKTVGDGSGKSLEADWLPPAQPHEE